MGRSASEQATCRWFEAELTSGRWLKERAEERGPDECHRDAAVVLDATRQRGGEGWPGGYAAG